jgi:hypothetical protein
VTGSEKDDDDDDGYNGDCDESLGIRSVMYRWWNDRCDVLTYREYFRKKAFWKYVIVGGGGVSRHANILSPARDLPNEKQ